jgi:hypothetical protein
MSDRFLKQRTNYKFCAKLEQNASDTCAILSEAYWGEAMKKSSVFEWRKQFKEDPDNVKDDEISGRQRSHTTDENVETFKYQRSLICENTEVVT